MRPTLRTASIATAAFVLLVACHAAAAPGPRPGMSPEEYAVQYAKAQADNATRDPVGYVQAQATPSAIGNQTSEAGYIVCWTAYDATGNGLEAVCAPFFSAPGKAPPADEEANATAAPLVGNVTDAAGELANTTLDAVVDTVKDPESAPSQLDRIVSAVQGFLATVGEVVASAVAAVVDVVRSILGALGIGIGNAVGGLADGLAALGLALGNGIRLGIDGLVAGVQGLGSGIAAGAQGIGSFFVDVGAAVAGAAQAAGRAVGDAVDAAVNAVGAFFGSVGNGIAAAARSAADGVQAASRAVGDAVSSAADAIGKAIGSLFGGGDAQASAPQAPRAPAIDVPIERPSLLDRVADRLPT